MNNKYQKDARIAELVAENSKLRNALILALDSHGVVLLSDPPQDAWKAGGVQVSRTY